MHRESRIFIVIPSLTFGGGAERLVFDIYSEIKSRNIAVKMIVGERVGAHIIDGNRFENLLIDDANVHFLNEKISISVLGRNNKTSRKFIDLVDSFRPTVMHSHLFKGEIISRSYLDSGIKYFSHFHDNMGQLRNWSWTRFPKKRDLTDFFEKLYLLGRYRKNGGTKFLTISKSTFEYANLVLPKIHRKNIFLLPNAVNLSRFSGLKKSVITKRIKLLNIGSLIPLKNQKFLFQVVKELKKRGLDVQLDCLGEGVSRTALEEEIVFLGLENDIRLLGNCDVENYLCEASVYVHSSKREAFGLVLIEAMASGTPVISLNGKGNSDIVINGVSGFLMKDENIQSFADQIVELTSDQLLYDTITASAAKFASQYDIKSYADTLLKIYQGGN